MGLPKWDGPRKREFAYFPDSPPTRYPILRSPAPSLVERLGFQLRRRDRRADRGRRMRDDTSSSRSGRCASPPWCCPRSGSGVTAPAGSAGRAWPPAFAPPAGVADAVRPAPGEHLASSSSAPVPPRHQRGILLRVARHGRSTTSNVMVADAGTGPGGLRRWPSAPRGTFDALGFNNNYCPGPRLRNTTSWRTEAARTSSGGNPGIAPSVGLTSKFAPRGASANAGGTFYTLHSSARRRREPSVQWGRPALLIDPCCRTVANLPDQRRVSGTVAAGRSSQLWASVNATSVCSASSRPPPTSAPSAGLRTSPIGARQGEARAAFALSRFVASRR